MPQFELDAVGPECFSGRVRGRTPEEAVRRVAGLDEAIEIALGGEDLQGWRAVEIDGGASGRIRLHQRMQFRRD